MTNAERLRAIVDDLKVRPQAGCVEFNVGGTDAYGRFGMDGRLRLAHRVAYSVFHGVDLDDMDGMVVRHECDNPPCVNPAHLRLGTQAENVADMCAKGRLVNPLAAQWAAQTACSKGHPYTVENTFYYRGTRRCRACGREYARLKRERFGRGSPRSVSTRSGIPASAGHQGSVSRNQGL